MMQLIELETEALRSSGLGYPKTEHQARHLLRNRETNGFAGAFARVGNRWFLDRERYIELARKNAAA